MPLFVILLAALTALTLVIWLLWNVVKFTAVMILLIGLIAGLWFLGALDDLPSVLSIF
ncbi:MAG: hypothetical protein R6U17_02135 [Thermoplasmata archaeon]